MIVDLDSHLRERYFRDEIYCLPEPFSSYTPRKVSDGPTPATKFVHALDPNDPKAMLAFKRCLSTTSCSPTSSACSHSAT